MDNDGDFPQRRILTTETRMKVLSAINANQSKYTKDESEEKRLRMHSKTIEEILSTEKTYLHHLELLIKYFLTPLESKGILTPREYKVLFGKIPNIQRINQELLTQLGQNEESIGKAFLELAPFFKMYCSFANSYEDAMALIQKLEMENKQFAEFVHNQESRPEVAMKLSALMVTPIQRIPRYKLLLDELLQHTPDDSEDYKVLQSASQEIGHIANHINDCIIEHDNMQKMLTIQRSLIGGQPKIVIPGRRLIKDGPLMKVSRKGDTSHKRIFFLFSDMVMYCKQKGTDYNCPSSLICCCILPIKHCSVEQLFECGEQRGCLLKLSCKEEILLLYTDNSEVGTAWIQAIKTTIRRFSEFRKTLRKESSAKRPIRRAAIVKQKIESVSHLKRKPVSELEPNLSSMDDPECNLKDSLFPMRDVIRTKECVPPFKKPRLCSEDSSKISDSHSSQMESVDAPLFGGSKESVMSITNDGIKELCSSTESKMSSESSSNNSCSTNSSEVIHMTRSNISLKNAKRFFSTKSMNSGSGEQSWNRCIVL